MPYKDPDKRRLVTKRWYEANKDQHNATVRRHRKAIQQWVRDYKAGLKCTRCPENHPGCLQFHHTDPSAKEIGIREAVKNNWSLKRLQTEIAKCEVLCANCHMKEHYVED